MAIKSETKSSKDTAGGKKSSSSKSKRWYRTPVDFGPGVNGSSELLTFIHSKHRLNVELRRRK